MAVAGDRDVLGMLEHVRASVTTLGSGGVKPDDIVVPGGTHAGAFDTVLPQISEFFAKHSKSTRACAHGDWELGETVGFGASP